MTTLVACLGVVTAYLPFTGTTTALPTIAQQLHASTSDLQWVSDLFVIAMAAALLPAGVLGDVHGRKKVFVAGLGLTLDRVGHRDGRSQRAHPVDRRGRHGLRGGRAAAFQPGPDQPRGARPAGPGPAHRGLGQLARGGLAIGGVSAGVILGHAQWQWIFVPVAGIAVVILLIAVLALADSRAPAGRTLDWFGQVLAATAVAALVYGVIEGGSTGWSAAHAVAGFAVAAVAVLGFIPVELNVASPMLDLALFRSRGYAGAVAVATIGMFALTGSLFVLSLYYGTVQHLSGLDIAWRIAAACVVMIVAGPSPASRCGPQPRRADGRRSPDHRRGAALVREPRPGHRVLADRRADGPAGLWPGHPVYPDDRRRRIRREPPPGRAWPAPA